MELQLERLGLSPEESYRVHDLLTDTSFLWKGPRNYIELNLKPFPAHIFRIGK